jgi:NAD(P)-dependent dehydrogenase (short-subunit alcohol dehydrogenase family)
MLETRYDAFHAYSQSKLAMVMATMELARRLDPGEVTVNCVHPGSLLDTKMVRQGFGAPQGPVETGITTELFAAASPDLDGVTGRYFEEKRAADPHPQARDAAARRRLWQISEALTGVSPPTDA